MDIIKQVMPIIPRITFLDPSKGKGKSINLSKILGRLSKNAD